MTPNQRIEALREKGFSTEEAKILLFNPLDKPFYTMYSSFLSNIMYKPENRELNALEVLSWIDFYKDGNDAKQNEITALRKQIAKLEEDNNFLRKEISDLQTLNLPENGV